VVRETVLLSRAVAEQAAELDGAYRRLQAVESAKSKYMRKVSHELRGPLGTIQTALKVVLHRVGAALAPGVARSAGARGEAGRRARRGDGRFARAVAGARGPAGRRTH